MKGKTFYYSDPLNDDFAGTDITRRSLPETYEYIPKSPIRRGFAWFLHHFIVTPVCFVYLKIAFGQKIVGRKKLRPYRKSGYFLFGNHTRLAGDAFTPTMVSFPKKPFIVVNADAVSIPGCKRLVEDLGGMPLPDGYALTKKFCAAVAGRSGKGGVIAIYPEAHIWPLYTGIRPFASGSFAYPIRAEKPVFTFTTTYKKRKLFGGVKATVYVDGPFFPDPSAEGKERKEELRNRVYAAMLERSRQSTYSPNRFIERESENVAP